MTLLEFWGCSLITFGPALAMFCQTVAHDPIKIIVLISSAFFWLLSFLLVAICWAIIKQFCDYLIVGAILAVLSQELFRYLFHNVTKRAQVFLDKLMAVDNNQPQQQQPRQPHRQSRQGSGQGTSMEANVDNNQRQTETSSRVTDRTPNEQIQITGSTMTRDLLRNSLPLSYVSGLGFGLINAAFSLMNVLTDHVGPGTVGFMGDSQYFVLVSSLIALAFILLNVAWSVIMSVSIEKQDKKLAGLVIGTHLLATLSTFFNRMNLQLLSIVTVYSLTGICGFFALQAADIDPLSLISKME